MAKQDLFEELFDPSISYEGMWLINSQLFKSCELKNKKGQIDEFFKKQVINKINDIVGWAPLEVYLTNYGIDLLSVENDNRVGRKFCVDKYCLFITILEILEVENPEEIFANPDNDKERVPSSEMGTILRNKLLEIKRELIDVRDNKTKSSYYAKYLAMNRNHNGQAQSDISFDFYIDLLYKSVMILLPKVKYLDEFCDQRLNIDAIKDKLDLDKFYLRMALELFKLSIILVDHIGSVHNSLIYCEQYLDYVAEIRTKQPGYNCSIKANGEKCTIDVFAKAYERFKFEHPEFKILRVDLDEREDIDALKDIDYSIQQSEAIFSQVFDNNFRLNWQVLPEGERLAIEPTTGRTHSRNTTRENKVSNVISCKSFLDNSNPMMVISGINDFEGYIGYIYANGIVIFEKFFEYYKGSKHYRVAVDNATYVMDITNFVEMSKKSKIDLVQMIKNQEVENLLRISHDHVTNLRDWKRKVLAFTMMGRYQIDKRDVKEYVNRQLECEGSTPKGPK